MIRGDIVTAARGWIGTRFQHQARLQGVGVDCIGLVIGVSRELGLVAPDFDIGGYPGTPDGTTMLELADQHMTRVSFPELQLGDVIAIRWATDPQHFGILADYLHGGFSMIHAYGNPGAPGGKVIEQRLDESMRARFVAAYRLPGVPV